MVLSVASFFFPCQLSVLISSTVGTFPYNNSNGSPCEYFSSNLERTRDMNKGAG